MLNTGLEICVVDLLFIVHSSTSPPYFLKGWGWGIDFNKNPKKGGMGKLLKDRGDSVGKGEIQLICVFFLAGVWQI